MVLTLPYWSYLLEWMFDRFECVRMSVHTAPISAVLRLINLPLGNVSVFLKTTFKSILDVYVIFLGKSIWRECCKTSFMSTFKSTLVKVMAWCRQATSISWVNLDPDPCRHMGSLVHNGFSDFDTRITYQYLLGLLYWHWVNIRRHHYQATEVNVKELVKYNNDIGTSTQDTHKTTECIFYGMYYVLSMCECTHLPWKSISKAKVKTNISSLFTLFSSTIYPFHLTSHTIFFLLHMNLLHNVDFQMSLIYPLRMYCLNVTQ